MPVLAGGLTAFQRDALCCFVTAAVKQAGAKIFLDQGLANVFLSRAEITQALWVLRLCAHSPVGMVFTTFKNMKAFLSSWAEGRQALACRCPAGHMGRPWVDEKTQRRGATCKSLPQRSGRSLQPVGALQVRLSLPSAASEPGPSAGCCMWTWGSALPGSADGRSLDLPSLPPEAGESLLGPGSVCSETRGSGEGELTERVTPSHSAGAQSPGQAPWMRVVSAGSPGVRAPL